jgi:DNA-binding transcriptional MerR regulator
MKAPDAFRTISEVAEDLDLPQHVLRFWETRFHQIKPMKRGGGRRYYRPEDVDLLRGIRLLLYAEGFTIRGVQRLLKENGVGFVMGVGQTGTMPAVKSGGKAPSGETDLASLDDETDEAGGEAGFDSAGDALPDIPVRARQADEAHRVEPRRQAPGLRTLSPEGRRRIEIALADLLEAKRLLDQVR